MAKNEIRLRRHKISSGRIARHRNYGDLLSRHERDARMKRIFTYSIIATIIILTILIISFLMVRDWEKNQKGNTKARPSTAYVVSHR